MNDFRKLVMERILEETCNWTKGGLVEQMMIKGFPRFDIDRLNEFIKGLDFFINFETMAIPTGLCKNQYWLVSGFEAIVITMPEDNS